MSPDISVVRLLRLLHPERRRHEALSAQAHPIWTISPLAASPVDSDEVVKAVKSFTPTSCSGPSGLRPNHTKEALRPASAKHSRACSPKWSCFMLQGWIPQTVRHSPAVPRSLLCVIPTARFSPPRSWTGSRGKRREQGAGDSRTKVEVRTT